MGNKYFGQQHSHSRDIPHHVRRCFVGISDPLLGSYFHGRILHRILFKSSWSPDTRYPANMVNMLLASSSNTHMHQPTTQLPQYFRSQSDYFQTCFWECACKILHVIVLFLFLARIAAVTALDTFSVSLQVAPPYLSEAFLKTLQE